MKNANDFIAYAFETLTVGSGNTATALTRSIWDPAGQGLPVCRAILTVNTGPVISYTIDGTTVTNLVGHKVSAFGTIAIDGFQNIKQFRSTSVSTGTTASLAVTYYR